MLENTTKQRILVATLEQFALSTADGFSMRKLAKDVGVVQSVIYHYFSSKDQLLKEMFDSVNTQLGKDRAVLPSTSSAKKMLEQRVEFQLDHAKEVVGVLKYFLTYRDQFKKLKTGFVPDKAYLHIEEVLERGIADGIFIAQMNVGEEAKVITHAINGFLLEYYPYIPQGKERKELVAAIIRFLWRGIEKKR